MTVLIDPRERLANNYGIQVSRATAALPQTAAGALFNITGGRIILTSIIGEVTTVIQTQANNTKLQSNPTTGTTGDLCAVLDITADEVGCLYGITGVPGDALIGAGAAQAPVPLRRLVIPVGAIELNCAASNTGSVKWTMTYLPLDAGASVAAA